MFQNILVPVDGSDLSQRALRYARVLATASKGTLILVRASQAHPFPGSNPIPSEVQVVRQAEEETEALCNRLWAEGSAAEWHVYYGHAPGAIEDEVDIRQADTIVMSTHGRGGLGKLVYGSVAEAVVARATVPVLLIPARCERVWPPQAGQRIIVPLDESRLAEAAIEPAIELAEALAAGILLTGFLTPVYAGFGPEVYPAADLDADLQELNGYLSDVAERVRAKGVPCSTLADIADPEIAIPELTSGKDIVAVVMATHGRTGLSQVVMGSVAMSVVQRSVVPVLVMRPVPTAVSSSPVQEPVAHYAT